MKIRSLDKPSEQLKVFADEQGDIYINIFNTKGDPFGRTVRIGGPNSGHSLPSSLRKILYALVAEFNKYKDVPFESDAARAEDNAPKEQLPYPVTICADPNCGRYMPYGKFIAFPLEAKDIPDRAIVKVIDDDFENALLGMDQWTDLESFWKYYDEPYGKGNTPDEALQDLTRTMQETEYRYSK